jgi:type VI secretion system secreted protein Hcp
MHPAGNEDIFLKLDLAKSGPVKGEAADSAHPDEIQLTGWSWGMKAATAMGTGKALRPSIDELRVTKAVDRASTVLMAALRNNDAVRKAILTVRKAGKTPHEYLKLTIEKGRVSSYDVQAAPGDGIPTEVWSFAFAKVEVEYRQQLADGQLGGSLLYADDWTQNA